jgi:hypothetical protein
LKQALNNHDTITKVREHIQGGQNCLVILLIFLSFSPQRWQATDEELHGWISQISSPSLSDVRDQIWIGQAGVVIPRGQATVPDVSFLVLAGLDMSEEINPFRTSTPVSTLVSRVPAPA